MAANRIQITDAGRAALVAPGNTGTTAHKVTQIGLGTMPFQFKPDMNTLPSEVKRITTFGGDTVAPDTVHLVIQDDTADQYKLHALGLYLDNGVLFGVYVQNDPILEKAPASMLLLAVDVVFASIDAAKLEFGPATFLNPPATTDRKGVVELATQTEVDDGTDDTRAVTPKTAAAHYAPLVAPRLTGPVNINATADNEALAINAGGKNRLRITAAGRVVVGSADDDGANLLQVAGNVALTGSNPTFNFTNGGPAIWMPASKTLAITNGNGEVMRITPTGRVLIGTTGDDNLSAALVVGGHAATRGQHTFGSGKVVAWVNSDAELGYFRTNGHMTLGSESSSGVVQIIAGNTEAGRFVPGGRMLLGTTEDDGATRLQGRGNARFTGEFQSTNPNGLRVVYGDYGVFLRSDGTNAFLMQTNARDHYGDGNAYRPFQWGLRDGVVTIDGTGAGANFGGSVSAAKGMSAGGPVKAVGAFVATNGGGTGQTALLLRREGAAVDQKQWEIVHGGDGALTFRAVNDAYSRSLDAFYITRASGLATATMGLMPNGGRVLIGSTADDGVYLLQVNGEARMRGVVVDGGESYSSTVYFATNGKTRFTAFKNAAENFQLNAWDDSGNQNRVLEVDRNSQTVSFDKSITAAGARFKEDARFDKQASFNQGIEGLGTAIYNDSGKYNLVFRTGGPGAPAFAMLNERGELRLPTRPVWNYTPWDSGNFNPGSKIDRAGDTVAGPLRFAKDGWDSEIEMRASDGAGTFLRARRTGGLEIINGTHNDVNAWFGDSGIHTGDATLQKSGNLYMPWAGQWLDALLGGNVKVDFFNQSPGLFRHSSGFTAQWSFVTGNFSEGPAPFQYFPLAFPNGPHSIVATACNNNASPQTDSWMQIVSWDRTRFQPYVQSSAASAGVISGYFWIAIGG
jgi:hypothetical protein